MSGRARRRRTAIRASAIVRARGIRALHRRHDVFDAGVGREHVQPAPAHGIAQRVPLRQVPHAIDAGDARPRRSDRGEPGEHRVGIDSRTGECGAIDGHERTVEVHGVELHPCALQHAAQRLHRVPMSYLGGAARPARLRRELRKRRDAMIGREGEDDRARVAQTVQRVDERAERRSRRSMLSCCSRESGP